MPSDHEVMSKAPFMSKDLQEFMTHKGIAMRHTTSENPAGNGEVEWYNSTSWKALLLLKS